jgi:hypothetical protein
VLGLDEPKVARQYLGAIRSTLGRKRDLPTGARSTKPVTVDWPEVYVGDQLLVHHAYIAMRADLKAVMDAHYVARAPIAAKADALAVSLPTYWILVREAKAFIEGRLSA